MAMILDTFVGKCVERLSVLVEAEVILVLGVKDELKRLQRRLRRIQSVLKDAERRRIQDAAVNDWLNELKDVMYDADDILDLCRFEGGRWLEDHPSSSSSSSSASPVRCFSHLFSCFTNVQFHHEIGSRIKILNDRLEEISKDKLTFTLESSKPCDMRSRGVDPRQTSPLEEEDVVGDDIQDATNQLAELIIGEKKKKCRVFAIVGMGGIGKTTLAQKLYNEPRIMNNFQEEGERIWVCISQSFSETELLRKIISSAGGNPGDAQTKDRLLLMLKDIVMEKRLFLVLDDVWEANVWVDMLRIPLRTGPASCTIVVTTRKEDVAKMMGAEFVHAVEVLSVESGWKMLRNRVFINGEEEEIQSLREVGIQIVEKCGRLPLAIKTIAGVLSARDRTRGEWEKVVGSDAWSMSQLPEELRGALYLSYEDLPSHLKQCFLYLSLFPEDYIYSKFELVRLWIAEGFVEAHVNSLEDTAEEYYRELVGRSMLDTSIHSSMNWCKMHDLLRSLACFISANECFCGSVERISNSGTSQLRRLCIEGQGDDSAVLTADSIIRHNRLRTFLLFSWSQAVESGLISGLRHLRVLNVQAKKLDHVPYFIGDLIHLRYLDLNQTGVSELPDSLGRLTNLQFLNISNCSALHTLPEGITRLCNLRSLDMYDTPIRYVPKGIGKLHLLNHLNGIVLGEDNSVPVATGKPQQGQGCDLEDLGNLSQLRFLSILRLEKSSTGMMALQSKSHLKELRLRCSYETYNIFGQQPYTEEEKNKIVKMEKIFTELTPPSCLESMYLGFFFGRSYPSWMSGSFLPHLTDIILSACCPQLPPLGELPQLKIIKLYTAAVVTIGPEFMGSTSTAFPKLESLNFTDMANWEEWWLGGEIEERAAGSEGMIENRSMMLFPGLQHLVLWQCPNLRLLPISSFPALKSLYINKCPALKVVASQNALQELKLRDRRMECLPEWLKELLQQRLQAEDTTSNFYLSLNCSDILFRKCLMDGPEWPIIQPIPQVYIFGDEADLRYTKDPFSYKITERRPLFSLSASNNQ